jgi:REP element-mobilizing transposase RayT
MGRTRRELIENGIYHVTSRGNNRENIFADVEEKNYLLYLLEKYNEKYEIEIYSYAVMDNHYHLMLKTLNPNLSLFIKVVNTQYAKFHINKYDKTGHVFERRFRSRRLCERTYDILMLIRYIHYNPIRAEMCRELNDYRWTSHNIYINEKYNNKIVDLEKFYKLVGKNKTTGKIYYERWMEK